MNKNWPNFSSPSSELNLDKKRSNLDCVVDDNKNEHLNPIEGIAKSQRVELRLPLSLVYCGLKAEKNTGTCATDKIMNLLITIQIRQDIREATSRGTSYNFAREQGKRKG